MIYYENTVPVSLDVNASIYSINVNIDAVTIEQDLGIDTAIQVVTGDHYDGPCRSWRRRASSRTTTSASTPSRATTG